MTPYELETAERAFQGQMTNVVNRNGPATAMLRIIFEMQAMMLRHMADVEAEAHLERNQRDRE
jgi:hypothetical protein